MKSKFVKSEPVKSIETMQYLVPALFLAMVFILMVIQ